MDPGFRRGDGWGIRHSGESRNPSKLVAQTPIAGGLTFRGGDKLPLTENLVKRNEVRKKARHSRSYVISNKINII